MAVETRSAHPTLLWPGVAEVFGDAYKDKPEYWRSIFEEQKSDKHLEITVAASYYGLAPIKGEGAPIQYDQAREGAKYTHTNTTYALGYIVTREELEDNQYERVAKARASELARSMRATKETAHANVLNRAFNASYLGGDGVVLCSTAHPTAISGTQSNRLAVDADLSEASIEDMVKLIVNFKNDRGIRIQVMPRQLIVPVNEMFNATRYVNSTLRPASANNDVNAINYMNVLPDGIMVYPYLTDDDAWFITTDQKSGLKSFNRREVDFDKDEDFGTENARSKSTMRFVASFDDFRAIGGSQGA